jgi:uncharacterized membrane protein YcaP (DUF421 family)
MPLLLAVEWHEFYTTEKPLVEIFLRGTFVYLCIFFLLRVLLKRQAGNVGLTDMLLIVLIADASQNAMANDYKSVPDGLFLVGTLIFWNYFLDWLGYRWQWFGRLLESPPLPLIRDGQVLKENLRKECLTEDELTCQLRKKGYADPAQVREGYIEGDGHFSFLPPPTAAPGRNPSARNGVPPVTVNGRAEPPATSGGTPEEPAPGESEAMSQFLDAAQRLREAVAWHQARVAEHQQAVAVITHAFTQHGIRPRAFLKTADEGHNHDVAPPMDEATTQ